MADRLVLRSRKGYAGDVLALCNPGESWSPRFKNDAIRDIEDNIHSYFIERNGVRISIVVCFSKGSKYLITENKISSNNYLGELENC